MMINENPILASEALASPNIRRYSKTGEALKIAIDGPAGAGKSTVAKKVAEVLGYLYIDTGAMYRAATWLVMEKNVPVTASDAITKLVAKAHIELKPAPPQSDQIVHVFVDGHEVTKEIRSQKVTSLVSPVSQIAGVRKQLVNQQRKMAESGGVVLDGRDIGTVVLPDAEVKIFLTASPEIRAYRRFKELREKGEPVPFNTLLAQIIERDRIDSTREIAPLRIADDAVAIFTDHMTVDEVVAKIIALCN